ncbi:MAG: hypothetical protein LBR42_04275 [Candidatus Methanoplasma sp.]|jgi:hypothetical protein|nr:hypothetical protein [Candidatus Methanoplasma sp.]
MEEKQLIYEVIARTEPEETAYENLSYEDVLSVMIDNLLLETQVPLTIRRRCCSSVKEHTMSVETCHRIRELAGAAVPQKDGADLRPIRVKLDIAINNWYIKGEISLSEERIIKPSEYCYANRQSA